MPIVPTISPSHSTTPNMSVNTPAGAFGAESARAGADVGRALTRAGDELFERAMAFQELQNRAEATDLDTEYTIQAGKLHAEYNALQGKAAVDAYPSYQE